MKVQLSIGYFFLILVLSIKYGHSYYDEFKMSNLSVSILHYFKW